MILSKLLIFFLTSYNLASGIPNGQNRNIFRIPEIGNQIVSYLDSNEVRYLAEQELSSALNYSSPLSRPLFGPNRGDIYELYDLYKSCGVLSQMNEKHFRGEHEVGRKVIRVSTYSGGWSDGVECRWKLGIRSHLLDEIHFTIDSKYVFDERVDYLIGRKITKLSLKNDQRYEEVIKLILASPNLRDLVIDVSLPSLDLLPKFLVPSLEYILFSCVDFDLESIQVLGSALSRPGNRIRKLEFFACLFGIQSVEVLMGNGGLAHPNSKVHELKLISSHLQWLDIHYLSQYFMENTFQSVKKLTVALNSLTGPALESLTSALQHPYSQLNSISLDHIEITQKSELEALLSSIAFSTSIDSVSFGNHYDFSVTARDLSRIMIDRPLTSLALDDYWTASDLEFLSACKGVQLLGLKSLKLSFQRLDRRESKLLANLLSQRLINLQRVSLKIEFISPYNLKLILQALANSISLESLTLDLEKEGFSIKRPEMTELIYFLKQRSLHNSQEAIRLSISGNVSENAKIALANFMLDLRKSKSQGSEPVLLGEFGNEIYQLINLSRWEEIAAVEKGLFHRILSAIQIN